MDSRLRNIDTHLTNYLYYPADLSENLSPFASAIVREGNMACMYSIGGAHPDFWNEGNGPFVSNVNLKYCTDITVGTDRLESDRPVVQLFQNYPNPFNASTIIPYELENPSDVRITLFTMDGQEIQLLYKGFQASGRHTFEWIPGNIVGGIYYYQLETNAGIGTKKLIYLL